MNLVHYMPTIIIVCSTLSAIAYLIARDPWHAMYWFFAAGLNVCVTFMKG